LAARERGRGRSVRRTDLELQPSGLIVHGCTLIESNGRRWVHLPARPQNQKDGSPVIDRKTGKPAWAPIIEIKDRASCKRFEEMALRAVDELLGKKGVP
jgi:hypothetical protein